MGAVLAQIWCFSVGNTSTPMLYLPRPKQFHGCIAHVAHLAALGCAFAASPAAQASYNPAVILKQPVTPEIVGNYTFGYSFSTSIDRIVNGIGLFDAGMPGMLDFHSAALWKVQDNISSLVFQQDFPAGQDCFTESNYCWKELAPLSLEAGMYVIGATWAEDGDLIPFRTTDSNPEVYAFIDTTFGYRKPMRSRRELDSLAVDFTTNRRAWPELAVSNDAAGYFSATLSFQKSIQSRNQDPSLVADSPAPLPLLGVWGALAWSRKIRARIS
jgi:hypothetical protein